MKKNIVITFGGDSCEKDISVITAFMVKKQISDLYNVYMVYLCNGEFYVSMKKTKISDYSNFFPKRKNKVFFSGKKMIFSSKVKKSVDINCAIMCNHGGEGEDGSLSGLFETAKIPYTACNGFTAAIFMDKIKTKEFLINNNLPTLDYVYYDGKKAAYCGNTVKNIHYPCILKPASLGSSVGINVAHNEEELTSKLNSALLFDRKILIENFLDNIKEFNCAAYFDGNDIVVSDIEKPDYGSDIYSFDDKYVSRTTKSEFPASISEHLANRIREITKTIYYASDAKGVIRVDYIYSDENLYVSEVNAIPGSLAFYLFKLKKISFKKLLLDLIAVAVKERCDKDSLQKDYTSDVLKFVNESKLHTAGKGKRIGL